MISFWNVSVELLLDDPPPDEPVVVVGVVSSVFAGAFTTTPAGENDIVGVGNLSP